MKINPSIFRAYDIRGIYPDDLNERVAYLIGSAFVKFLGGSNLNIVVGRDNRLSSPSLFSALTRGIIAQGANVIALGLSTTPMLYFATAYFKSDGGIEISASHNPPQYNGFKLVKKEAIPIGEKSGIKEIKGLVLGARFKSSKKGKIIKKKVIKEYLKFNLRNFDLGGSEAKALLPPLEKMKPLKIVIDTANAVAGILIPKIFGRPLSKKRKFFRNLNFKIYHLFPKLDGNFPGHFPDPLIKENLRALQKEVKNKKANLGVAFDGDGDRIIFLDERGEVIPGDLITALLSKIILKEKPGKKILYDVRSSNVVGETIKDSGGTPIVSRIGHTFIKEKMREKDIFFAGEFSGHYYLKEQHFCEAPIFVLLKILEIISSTGKNLSELILPFKKYFHSGEINFKVGGNKILEIMEKRYKNGKINHLDGVRIDFKNWWFLVRASQTEPVLRLVIEARTKEIFEEKKKELIEFIKSFSLG
ncbi:phosphomannomutase/phosphoglucomutase [Patescibacteria group bacterium]|nr:phosphomannomutase/phosphoglucomutase [Patescibacteria group bacterium]MBU4480917.1 phosphomannomutase/phosphoglucomutase [Patescibacteria group bacterium]